MSAHALLERLEGVRQTGPGRWVARCPAHADRSPSLSIRETDDGRVLVHDFAGCGALEVLQAVGLRLQDLFPPRLDAPDARYRKAPPIPYADALRCIGAESHTVLLAAGQIERGDWLSGADLERLAVAVSRISTACQVTRAWQ